MEAARVCDQQILDDLAFSHVMRRWIHCGCELIFGVLLWLLLSLGEALLKALLVYLPAKRSTDRGDIMQFLGCVVYARWKCYVRRALQQVRHPVLPYASVAKTRYGHGISLGWAQES